MQKKNDIECLKSINDSKLISYLKKNQIKSRHYFFRNGVYSLRIKEDIERINTLYRLIEKDGVTADITNNLNQIFLTYL